MRCFRDQRLQLEKLTPTIELTKHAGLAEPVQPVESKPAQPIELTVHARRAGYAKPSKRAIHAEPAERPIYAEPTKLAEQLATVLRRRAIR